MIQNLRNHIFVATFLILAVIAIAIGAWFVSWNQREVETQIRAELEAIRTIMVDTATRTDNNGADEFISSIITDCSRRSEFEALLVKLDTLSPKELITIQTLFESCGDFYPERKALMVAKLERELQSYSNLLTLLSTLTTRDISSYKEALWTELVNLEKERSALLSEQYMIQADIIEALIRGERVSGETVQTLVHDGSEVNQLLSVTARRITEKRESLNQ